MESKNRTKKWQRNPELENFLGKLSEAIEGAPISSKDLNPKIGLICGAARSGTSVVTQVLANSGLFGYPTNMISRFYSSPHLGAIVQKLYTNPSFDPLGEFSDLQNNLIKESFTSDLGKTKGALGVNEFWYFWRRFFSIENGETLQPFPEINGKMKRFIDELSEWSLVEEKTLLMKGLIANWNILFLAKLLPNSHFIYVHRDPVDNVRSLLKAREYFFGDIKKWYSFALPEICRLPCASPIEEVALQIACHDVLLNEQLSYLPDNRFTKVQLGAFCDDPNKISRPILETLSPENKNYPILTINAKKSSKSNPSETIENLEIKKAYDSFKSALEPIAHNLYKNLD